MLTLVPHWVTHYEEFEESITKRNLWFIDLRYGAVVMLAGMLIGALYIIKLQLTSVQVNAVITITCAILFYNLSFHYIGLQFHFKAGRFHSLHFSLFQMLLDLISLTLLVYYLGGIENPLYLFYMFHMIIGSLILPGVIIYILALTVILTLTVLFNLEYFGYIPHHAITGLLNEPVYNKFTYLITFLLIFGFMIIVSVIITNRIARELYKKENDLYDSIRKIKEAEAAKEKYVMGVVHEIKTPISAVQTILDLVPGGYLGSVNEDFIRKLNRARLRANEAIKMINNVLHISRLKLSDGMQQEDINICSIVESTICNQKANAESKLLSICFNNEINSSRNIKGNRVLLEIAFSNIISNAIKYTEPNGSIEVLLTENSAFQFLEVSDSGIGIPQDEIGDIFKEFYRAANIRQKNIEGTGLGLSLVQQIIKNHGGGIEVKSPSKLGGKENPGTSFLISLPYKSN